MRKVIVGAMVSMDGVMQAPGGPEEDPTGGFKFGGWLMPYFDQEFGEGAALGIAPELTDLTGLCPVARQTGEANRAQRCVKVARKRVDR